MIKYTFEEFKDTFSNTLESSSKKNNLIENEIKEIDIFIKDDLKIRDDGFFGILGSPPEATRIFKLNSQDLKMPDFIKAFNSYNLYGEFEIKRYETDSDENFEYRKSTYYQAKEFSEYYNWLKDLLKNNAINQSSNKSTLTHKQKMLALYYLGLNITKHENTGLSKIIAKIIGQGEENTRKYLSYVSGGKNDVRNVKNLEKLLKLFDIETFENIHSKIQEDIKSLKN